MQILFDNTAINSGNYNVKTIKHEENSDRDAFSYSLARERGNILVNTNFKTKQITINGIITGADQATLETNIDTFRELVSREAKNLDITYSTGTRRYVATATDLQIDRDFYNLSYAPYTLTFLVPSGVGIDPNLTTVTDNGKTAASVTETPTITGTIAPMPLITLTFTAASSATAVSITLNGNVVTLTNAIAANDVVIFDMVNKKVTLNGVEKDYTGYFPSFIIGSNSIVIAVTRTSATYNFVMTYYPTYL